jgi:hypothetical protein
MKNKSIEIKIEKMILMEKYVNIFIKNKDNNIFRDIFIMYVNDLDEELQKIKDKKTKKGRKKIYDNNTFFYYSFINLLQNGQTWKSMNNICSYSTYYRKFNLWTNNKVFINVYKIFINFLKNNKILKYKDLKNIFIDTTNIRNKHGLDYIQRNYCDKGKNGTKISVIVSKSGIPLSSLLTPNNIHDINTVISTINNSYINLNKSKLGGDKGYISKKIMNELKNNYNITFITHKRKKRRTKEEILYDKNNKIKHKEEKDTNKNIKFLKKRVVVENMFSWIKNNKRIQIRYDKYYKNYESFVNLAFIKLITNRFCNQYFTKNKIIYPTINIRLFRIYRNKILK